MKVIAVDNYGRDSVADELVAENLTAEEAEKLCAEKNATRRSDKYYVVANDDYELYSPSY